MKITIAQPCHEAWENMTDSGYGRYCDSCSKIVVDFTRMTDRELFQYFRNNPYGGCGRFTGDQINRQIKKPVLPNTEFFRRMIHYAVSLFLFLKISATKAFSQQQARTIHKTELSDSMAADQTPMNAQGTRVVKEINKPEAAKTKSKKSRPGKKKNKHHNLIMGKMIRTNDPD